MSAIPEIIGCLSLKCNQSRPAPDYGKSILLCFVLVSITRTLQYIPGFTYSLEVGIVSAIIGFGIIILRYPRSIGSNLGLELYVIILMIFLPIWSAVASNIVHRQPFEFGLLSYRGYWLSAFGLALLYSFRAGVISTREVDHSLVVCAWIMLVLYLLILFFLNPADYLSYGVGFIEDRNIEGYRFKFNHNLTVYAMFHYAVRGLRYSRTRWYILSGLLWLFLLGSAGGRMLTVGVVSSICIVLFHWRGFRKGVISVLGLCILIIFVISIALLVEPDVTMSRLNKFKDAFMALSMDSKLIIDESASSRVDQISIALPLIEDDLWTGSGRISGKWIEGAHNGIVGSHFYPDDIGIIGMVLQFGLLGTAFFVGQFVFGFKYAFQIRREQSTIASDTCELYLVFLAVSSIGMGTFVMFPELVLLMVVLLFSELKYGKSIKGFNFH
jgi:hypothetical protein